MQISGTIITKNEERVIAQCLENIREVVDEIVVLDSGSTDRTVEIAKGFTEKVFHREFTNFSEQKNHAASLASHRWILNVDADEKLSSELKDRLRILKDAKSLKADAFCFPRMTFQANGSLVFNIVSYPGFHYRLYDRENCEWIHPVHETLQVRGKRKFYPEHLLHYPDYSRVPQKEELYDRLRQMKKSGGKTFRPITLAANFWFHFRALFIDLAFYRKGWTYWKHGARILYHLAGLRLKNR